MFAFAEPKAKDLLREASQKSSVDDSVLYLKNQIKNITVPSEKRSAYILLASLQEQLSLYSDAQKNYALAAGITAGDGEDMPKKSNEQIVLDAVRCSLCCGDCDTADSYLNSAVRNSKNERIQSYVKLYSQWSSLCKAESVEELNEPLELLKAYLNVDSMKSIHSVILLTLWYVTGESKWSELITKNYSTSTEAAIVKGDVQLLPTPFWFFVPKKGIAEQGIGTFSTVITNESSESSKTEIQKNSKWQLGLFKTESNAKLLCEEVKNKGFDAYVISETRSSGTTYYLVLVNDDQSGSVAEKLRSSGYDCYLVD